MGLSSYFSTLALAAVGKAAPAAYARGALGDGSGGGAPHLDLFRRGRAPTAAELVAENVNTAYACASLNADLVASSTLRLYVSTGRGQSRPKMSVRGECRELSARGVESLTRDNPRLAMKLAAAKQVEEVLTHPLLDLLVRPNADEPDGVGMGLHQLFDFTQMYQEVVGRAYWYTPLDGVGGIPSAIWVLAAQHVREVIDRGTDQVIDRYVFGNGPGRQEFAPEEIVPFRCPDLDNPYVGGVSPMRAVFEKIRLNRKVDAVTNALLDNGGMPSALFTPKGDSEGGGIGEHEAERLRYKLRMMLNYAGRGGIMVAEGPGALHPLQWPVRDLADFQTLQLTKIDIANAYQVPPALLDPQDANLNGIRMAQYLHARYAGVKRLRRIESALNAFLLPKYDPSGRLFVCYDSPVPEDRAELREESKVLILGAAITRNELRKRHGMEELPGSKAEELVEPKPAGEAKSPGAGDG